METLLWVLVPLLILGIGWWWLSRTRKRTSAQVAGAVGPQAAAEASGRLDAESHRAVYRKLATADFMGAVQEYRAATGQGIKQCIIAVRSLEAHPQVYKAPAQTLDGAGTESAAKGTGGAAETAAGNVWTAETDPEKTENAESGTEEGGTAKGGSAGPGTAGAGRGGPGSRGEFRDTRPSATGAPGEQPSAPGGGMAPDAPPSTSGRRPADAELDSGDALMIPDDWSEQFGSSASRTTSTFRISAEQDGKTREFSTEELPPAEYDQFESLIRDHDFAGAAGLLAKFSGLDEDSIRQLLESAPVEGPASAASRNVSDFSFEGDGPDGRVSFSASDLPGQDRQLFLEHVGAGRTDEAAAIVHRHTGLPLGVVVKLLSAFGKGH